eukprot:388736-Amphidinium_carterae.1
MSEARLSSESQMSEVFTEDLSGVCTCSVFAALHSGWCAAGSESHALATEGLMMLVATTVRQTQASERDNL